MNKRISLLSGMMAALAFIPMVAAGTADASDKAKAKLTKSKLMPAGKEDPNIKVSRLDKVDPKPNVSPPPGKGGKKTRGAFCSVMVDNYTGWPIEIYVDGRYNGSVPAYGGLLTKSSAESVIAYGRVNFSDGSVRYWGPENFECHFDASRTWALSD